MLINLVQFSAEVVAYIDACMCCAISKGKLFILSSLSSHSSLLIFPDRYILICLFPHPVGWYLADNACELLTRYSGTVLQSQYRSVSLHV